MKSLCPYRNILGKVREGVHAYRFMDIAIVDVFMTVLGAYVIWWILHTLFKKTISFFLILIGLFGLGIVLHRLFCVPTTVDQWLFGKFEMV